MSIVILPVAAILLTGIIFAGYILWGLLTVFFQVAKLSKAFLKSIGGKACDQNSYPEPIGKWLKRKTVVEKKLK